MLFTYPQAAKIFLDIDDNDNEHIVNINYLCKQIHDRGRSHYNLYCSRAQEYNSKSANLVYIGSHIEEILELCTKTILITFKIADKYKLTFLLYRLVNSNDYVNLISNTQLTHNINIITNGFAINITSWITSNITSTASYLDLKALKLYLIMQYISELVELLETIPDLDLSTIADILGVNQLDFDYVKSDSYSHFINDLNMIEFNMMNYKKKSLDSMIKIENKNKLQIGLLTENKININENLVMLSIKNKIYGNYKNLCQTIENELIIYKCHNIKVCNIFIIEDNSIREFCNTINYFYQSNYNITYYVLENDYLNDDDIRVLSNEKIDFLIVPLLKFKNDMFKNFKVYCDRFIMDYNKEFSIVSLMNIHVKFVWLVMKTFNKSIVSQDQKEVLGTKIYERENLMINTILSGDSLLKSLSFPQCLFHKMYSIDFINNVVYSTYFISDV